MWEAAGFVALWTIVGLLQLTSLVSGGKEDGHAYRIIHGTVMDGAQRKAVNLTFFPLNIIALIEREQRFVISGWFSVTWYDRSLVWVPEEELNTTRMFVDSDAIWKPDLTITNGAESLPSVAGSKTAVIVTYDGLVTWYPGNVYSATCKMNLSSFPFDHQDCFFQVSTWVYSTDVVYLVPNEPPISADSWHSNSEWDLQGWSCVAFNHSSNGLEFPYLEYHFHLKRRSTFYVLKFLAPIVLLSIVNAFVFCVPPESGEKVSLAVSTMLSLTVFLAYLTDITPSNSDNVPQVAIFVFLHLALGACGVVCNILLLRFHFYRIKRCRRRRRKMTERLWTTSVEEQDVSGEGTQAHRKNTTQSFWSTKLAEDVDDSDVTPSTSACSLSSADTSSPPPPSTTATTIPSSSVGEGCGDDISVNVVTGERDAETSHNRATPSSLLGAKLASNAETEVRSELLHDGVHRKIETSGHQRYRLQQQQQQKKRKGTDGSGQAVILTAARRPGQHVFLYPSISASSGSTDSTDSNRAGGYSANSADGLGNSARDSYYSFVSTVQNRKRHQHDDQHQDRQGHLHDFHHRRRSPVRDYPEHANVYVIPSDILCCDQHCPSELLGRRMKKLGLAEEGIRLREIERVLEKRGEEGTRNIGREGVLAKMKRQVMEHLDNICFTVFLFLSILVSGLFFLNNVSREDLF